MRTPLPEPTPNDKIMVGSMLTMVSGLITASLDRFAGWVLGGFGAGLIFLLGSFSDMEKILDIAALRSSIRIFVWAAAIGVVGRYFGAAIVAMAKAGAKGEKLGKEYAAAGLPVTEGIFSEIERCMPWFGRWWVRRTFDKVRKGDYSASGRFMSGLAIFHSTLVFIGLCLALWALVTLSSGIKIQPDTVPSPMIRNVSSQALVQPSEKVVFQLPSP